MSYSKLALIILAITVMAIASGCPRKDTPGNIGDQVDPTGRPPAQITQPEQPDPAQEVEFNQSDTYDGNDQADFIDTWTRLGESESDLMLDINLKEEINLLLFSEWHIEKLMADNEDTFEMDLDPGTYNIQAVGGHGVKELHLYVIDSNANVEGQYIAFNEGQTKAPKIEFTADQPVSARLIFTPQEFDEGVNQAWYAWYLLTQE
ncbi:MAG: hypothetical protein NTY09_02010 [bacterium]|nr:hypothetical protein [bacterium]